MSSPSSSPWRFVGLNGLEERVEENDQGQRRVRTAAGWFLEGASAVAPWRIARLGAPSDQAKLAEWLAWPRVFASYGSVKRAAQVWFARPGHPCDRQALSPAQVSALQHDLHAALAARGWNARFRRAPVVDLPAWDGVLMRPGDGTVPLGLEMGLASHLGVDLPWAQWRVSPLRAAARFVLLGPQDPLPPRGVRVQWVAPAPSGQRAQQEWWVDHPALAGPPRLVSLSAWAGEAPSVPPSATVHYRPFMAATPSAEPSGYVPLMLSQALLAHRPTAPAPQLRAELARALGGTEEQLASWLSDDQMDAVFLASRQLLARKAFLLGDETGYGKGRTLAALARIALTAGHQVLFVTERRGLLSDFWRDASVLFDGAPPLPVIAHNQAKLLDPLGNPVTGLARRLPEPGDAWVWTTYSQFGRRVESREKAFLSWIAAKPTWVLLDEAHNAAGDSATGAAMELIQDAASGVVYSSATFAKTEQQLRAYLRLFAGGDADWRRLMAAFQADSETLRLAIALMWAEQGAYLRREHPPMALPDPDWIPLTPDLQNAQRQFARAWSQVYDCAHAFHAASEKAPPPWLRLGGALSRAWREFSLLAKMDTLVERLQAAKADRLRAVVVADWTLSSHATRLLDAHKTSLAEFAAEDETPSGDVDALGPSDAAMARHPVFSAPPLWRDSWAGLLNDLFPDDEILAAGTQGTALRAARASAQAALATLPAWSISPFDHVTQACASAADPLRLDEVSGRAWRLAPDASSADSWTLVPRAAPNRVDTVAQFNAGESDAVLLTRAGNSGISLHAGKTFKNQDQRLLIEWDIAPDPAVRTQFWGRVRRRDQVSEPLRRTLLLNSTAERRRYHREAEKQRRLVAHGGGETRQEGGSWSGPAADYLVRQWCQAHPAASLLGSQPTAQQALARAVILAPRVQDDLLCQMDRGLEALDSWQAARERSWSTPSRLFRRAWWWGQGADRLEWQQRVFESRPAQDPAAVAQALRSPPAQAHLTARDLAVQWNAHWNARWAQQPKHRTSYRTQWLAFWDTHHTLFERGAGVLAQDPATGEHALGVVLGYAPPPEGSWDASQIFMTVWLSTHAAPLTLPLSVWFDPDWGAIEAKGAAHLDWFALPPQAVSALFLVGPAWSVAAWGVRHAPQGHLVRIQDDVGPAWAWRMPAQWTWEDMRAADRELANLDHAMAYLKGRFKEPLWWRFSATEGVQAKPESGGVLLSGQPQDWERLPFPTRKRCGRPAWRGSEWTVLVPWRLVRQVFASLENAGAVPTVSGVHGAWVANHWPGVATNVETGAGRGGVASGGAGARRRSYEKG